MARSDTARARLGVDIGGTFTDIVLARGDGSLEAEKLLTTPERPDDALIAGVDALLRRAGVAASQVALIAHATTLFTNALIERKGPRTALVATKGFRDAVEIGREHRFDMYDLRMARPEPLAPRAQRYEIAERVLADGTVRAPLDRAEAEALCDRLVADGVEAVAICLMHSYAYPAHERALAAIFAERAPRLAVTASSDVAPVMREYDRASTALANVYVQALASEYLSRLEARLAAELGVRAPLFIMHSAGGLAAAALAAEQPIRFVQSGPAAGALGAARLAGADDADVMSFDMGGTTAKAAIILEGKPMTAPDFEVDRRYRFLKGSGLPVKIPVIEMIEIGAGGGSIARVDRLGRLQIGPDSASAHPGPACYGLGGVEATITDADLLLGYLDAGYFAGGAMRLDVDAAADAVMRAVGAPLGLDVTAAAWAIHRLANETMAEAARLHAVERGRDARRAALCAFGGAGPVHAFGVAAALRQRTIIYPRAAGVLSALGLLAAPMSFDAAAGAPEALEALDLAAAEALLSGLVARAAAPLEGHAPADATTIERRVEMRYRRQGFNLTAAVPPGPLTRDGLRRAFEEAYRAQYDRTVTGAAIDIVAWSATARGPNPEILAPAPPMGDVAAAVKGERSIWIPSGVGGAQAPAPVYARDLLPVGATLHGPAIIEERDSTVVLPGRAVAVVRADGALVAQLD